jgi:hypothetical protein
MLSFAQPPTVPSICEAYRTGTIARRQVLRLLYPGLRMEFDAIDVAEDRAHRIARSAQAKP